MSLKEEASSPQKVGRSVESSTARPTLAHRLQLGRLSGLYVLALFILVYALWIPHTFLTVGTLQSIVNDQAVTGVVAFGVVFALAAGAFDLSFATVMTMASVICGGLMAVWHTGTALAIVITVAAGLTVGIMNGLLVVKVGISSVIATLGMSSLVQAVIDRVTNDGQFITGFPSSFNNLTTLRPLGIPILAIYLFVIAVIAWYLLEHSPFGRRLQATGAGVDAARLAGVNTDRMVFLGLVASATMATIAGVLITSQIASVSPTIGSGYLLPVFAAVFLGTTQVKVGRFNIWGTVLAIFLLATGVKGLQLAGGQGWITDAFNGAALLLAVGVAALGQRRSSSSRLLPVLKRRSSRPDRSTSP